MAVTKASRRFFLQCVLLFVVVVVLLVISIADNVRTRDVLDAEADENEDAEIDDDDTDNGIATPNAVVVAAA